MADPREIDGAKDAAISAEETAARVAALPNATPMPMGAGARFTPGAMLLGRYRIVSPLGRGGMGEVYRADDLKLGHPVALKFLAPSLAADRARLERLYGEVRIGRQVSHPNVCRLYDIVEAEGHHFVAMEYVDGEDLASLLRRIGRLPGGKALEIARHLCAGLAAAHDLGVIHRDLKPANVMIDGRGTARLADFGLAALAEDVKGIEIRSGTPVYMAPEQLAGREVTFRSDLYGLGLILYEMFTGKRRFEAKTLDDLLAQHREAKTLNLSSTVRDVDPAVERVIVRCLDEDPAGRPTSAHAVMAALPGGDPLQAALDAGETPSPEMVAAAGRVGDLTPVVAWACFASCVVGLLAFTVLSGQTLLLRKVPLPTPPDALVARAREILWKLGYRDVPSDSAYQFSLDFAHLRYFRDHEASDGRWDELVETQPGPLLFYYRQSPRKLVANNSESRVVKDDPPMTISGMADALLDPRGHLVEFTGVPPQHDESRGPWSDPDWATLHREAGLDPASLVPTASTWAAPVDSDRRAAWDGSYLAQPDVSIHIEAASYRGKPVWFAILGPWSRPIRQEETPQTLTERISLTVFLTIAVAVHVGTVLLARRNLRLGRGDRKGAFVVAAFVFASSVVAAILRADHVADFFQEFALLIKAMSYTLYIALATWLLYIALEPYVRRRWPQMLISWNRLLAGRVRDPLVGRDLLAGVLAAVAVGMLYQAANLMPTWLGLRAMSPYVRGVSLLGEVRHLVFDLVDELASSVTLAMVFLCILLLLRVVFRRQRLAVAVCFVILASGNPFYRGESVYVEAIFAGLGAALLIGLLLRFGLLSCAVCLYAFDIMPVTPLTLDASAWYAGRGFLVLGVLVALAAYGFHASLGGKSMLGTALDD